MEFAPGIYTDVPREEYDAIVALNQTTIKVAYDKSLYHADYSLRHPSKPTQALIEGQALHTLILEPHLFDKRYAPMPVNEKGDKLSRRTKIGNEAWMVYDHEHGDKIPLKPSVIDDMANVRLSVRNHPVAAEMIDKADYTEAVVLWEHPTYGFPCKAQIDLFTNYSGWTWITDLKSARDASPMGFSRAIANYGYFCQAAWYLEGLNTLGEAERRFGFIAFEKEAPYGTAVYEIDPMSLYEGQHRCDKIAKRWARSLEKGTFEGYSVGVEMSSHMKWAMTHELEESHEV